MRLRVVLPVLSIILACMLFALGDVQTDKVMNVRRKTGYIEPIPDSYARARYLDYALNAPAWATLGEQRGKLRYRSTYWTGRDLRYFIALMVMWYGLDCNSTRSLGQAILLRRSRERGGIVV